MTPYHPSRSTRSTASARTECEGDDAMIRDIILACGCKVELTIIPPGGLALLDNTPIQGVLTYPCRLHACQPCVSLRPLHLLITGLN